MIAGRCTTGRNGAVWQTAMVQQLERRYHLDRAAALREMLRTYADGLQHNEPVHTWPL